MARINAKKVGFGKEILKVLQDYYAMPVMVKQAGGTAVGTHKIVKAGSLLTKDGAIANDATVRFVLLDDVDVTNGDKEGAGLYKAIVDETKLPVKPSAEAIKAMKGIIFVTEDDYK